ncbi:MAG TPA: hypothetical protein VFB17_04210, partial [Gaiellaceae bacterium]|nr:hypothetical protein [Gaiellaceae bacterium]
MLGTLAPPRAVRLPAAAWVLLAVVAMLGASVVVGRGIHIASALTLAISILFVVGATVKRWSTYVGFIVVVVMFIPIRRYQFGSGLPFDLEPYRILVFAIACLWIGTLLASRRLTVRGSGFEGPLGLFLIAILGS